MRDLVSEQTRCITESLFSSTRRLASFYYPTWHFTVDSGLDNILWQHHPDSYSDKTS